jgi:hypothetical protein
MSRPAQRFVPPAPYDPAPYDPAPYDPAPYDPWSDLALNWPDVVLRIEPMRGGLLGWLHYPVIALRAGTSAAQRRCTLAHEIVHLERGTGDCGPWAAREEVLVHAEAARRLCRLDDIAAAVRALGGEPDPASLAQALEVDRQTVDLRLARLTEAERTVLCAALDHLPWTAG